MCLYDIGFIKCSLPSLSAVCMAKHRQREEILKLIEKEKRRGFRKKERGIMNEKDRKRERERVKLSKRECE